MAAHTYWRLYIGAMSNVYAQMGTVSFLNAAQVNQSTGGTATASSEYGGSSWVAGNAFDGNPASEWASAGVSSSEWIAYQHPSPVDIVFVGVKVSTSYPVSGLALQYSDDGVSWSDASPLYLLDGQPALDSGSYTVLGLSASRRPLVLVDGRIKELPAGDTIPVGAVLPEGSITGDVIQTSRTLSAPDWLPCDGSVYLQSSYADLYAELGLIPDVVPGDKITNPATLPTGNAYGCSWVSSGTYLAVAHDTSPYITVYQRSGSTLTKLADPATLPAGVGLGCSWDSSGTYLAVAHDTSPYITVYQRSGSTLTKLANPATLPPGTAYGCSWDSSGTYLAVAHTTSPYITVYQRSGSTLTKLANPATLPTGNAYGCSWDSSGTYLAVAHDTSPYITVYQRSGSTLTKLADPAALPAGVGVGCSWVSSGTYLAVAHTTSPYITVYERSGSTLTKLANPATLPTGNAYGCAWVSSGTYLAVAHITSPYVTVYKNIVYDEITQFAVPKVNAGANLTHYIKA